MVSIFSCVFWAFEFLLLRKFCLVHRNMVISYVCRGLILSGAGDTERKETASSSLGACISGETEGCTGGGLNQVGGVKGEGVRGRRVELLHFLAHSEIYPRTK
jgi:hypothetical protein